MSAPAVPPLARWALWCMEAGALMNRLDDPEPMTPEMIVKVFLSYASEHVPAHDLPAPADLHALARFACLLADRLGPAEAQARLGELQSLPDAPKPAETVH